MILTAHQPVYLPWIGLFHKIALADAYCYMDNVQFQKNDWNNRNKIKGPNGGFWLTMPVNAKDHFERKIGQIEICNFMQWSKKHLKSIEVNYRKAPFYDQYIEFFRDCYNREWLYLSDLNEYMLKWFLSTLGISITWYKMSRDDYKGSKDDLIIDMCKKLNADAFIFGKLGKNYADVNKFSLNGIDVYFQDYIHPEYCQLYGGFTPYLSVIDLLFNAGPRSMEIIMSGNIRKLEKRLER